MRKYFQGISKDGNGKVVCSATVTAYLAGTTTLASIYTTLAGATAVNSTTSGAPTSSTPGFWEFYTDDFDYDSDQLFKIIISRSGFTSKTYDNITGEIVLGTYTIAADKTVTTHLVVPKGVLYSVATGKTLTLNGNVEAGDYQILTGLGTVTLSNATLIQRATWWGTAAANIMRLGYGIGTTYFLTYQADALADDGTYDLPASTSGIVIISCNAEGGMWLVETAGTVTKISGSTNTDAADTDGKLCVFDGGAYATVKNRLAATGEIRILYFYN